MGKRVVIKSTATVNLKEEEKKPIENQTLVNIDTKLLRSYTDKIVKCGCEYLIFTGFENKLCIAGVIPSEIIISIIYNDQSKEVSYSRSNFSLFLNPGDTNKRTGACFNETTKIDLDPSGLVSIISGSTQKLEQSNPNDAKVKDNILRHIIYKSQEILKDISNYKQSKIKCASLDNVNKLISVAEFSDEVQLELDSKMNVSIRSESNRKIESGIPVEIESDNSSHSRVLMHKDRFKMFSLFDTEFTLLTDNQDSSSPLPIMGYISDATKSIYTITSAKIIELKKPKPVKEQGEKGTEPAAKDDNNEDSGEFDEALEGLELEEDGQEGEGEEGEQ